MKTISPIIKYLSGALLTLTFVLFLCSPSGVTAEEPALEEKITDGKSSIWSQLLERNTSQNRDTQLDSTQVQPVYQFEKKAMSPDTIVSSTTFPLSITVSGEINSQDLTANGKGWSDDSNGEFRMVYDFLSGPNHFSSLYLVVFLETGYPGAAREFSKGANPFKGKGLITDNRTIIFLNTNDVLKSTARIERTENGLNMAVNIEGTIPKDLENIVAIEPCAEQWSSGGGHLINASFPITWITVSGKRVRAIVISQYEVNTENWRPLEHAHHRFLTMNTYFEGNKVVHEEVGTAFSDFPNHPLKIRELPKHWDALNQRSAISQ